MSSLITRGFYKYNRIITRGYGTGWLGVLRAEIVRFISKFSRVVELVSKFREEVF